MCDAHPDDAVSDPHTPPSGSAGPTDADGARLWRRIGRLVGRLARMGADLTRRMGEVADWREKTGATEGSFDLRLGWALVSRAARWTRALRARMRAAAAEVQCDVALVALPGFGPARDPAGRLPRVISVNAELLRRERYDFIDGLTAGAVAAQICADLADAATLLRATKAGRAIARMAAAARALLEGPDETWTKLPEPVRRGWTTAAELPAWQDAPAGLPAPDTG
jgi:hypothetical protein